MATDAYSLLRAWRACMAEPRPSDWERIVSNLLADTTAALEEEARAAGPAARKQYKVVDLSYSPDPRQHLKDVRAFHELDGWHLLSVVHLHSSGRWLYYLERDVEPDLPGSVVTAGADVTAEGVSVETMHWPAPKAGAGPS